MEFTLSTGGFLHTHLVFRFLPWLFEAHGDFGNRRTGQRRVGRGTRARVLSSGRRRTVCVCLKSPETWTVGVQALTGEVRPDDRVGSKKKEVMR